ncbi:unnamed protein product [Rhizoctonia solani]|uniref:Uncharacterized protein n=1 Tax=Rhizoctonia solani TaxID=456999 RepID=A0A8H3B5Z2_9AGAM|nr:unnamed protein product [Rhizoctonia solani]
MVGTLVAPNLRAQSSAAMRWSRVKGIRGILNNISVYRLPGFWKEVFDWGSEEKILEWLRLGLSMLPVSSLFESMWGLFSQNKQ